jgi:alcohol dehydrogenase
MNFNYHLPVNVSFGSEKSLELREICEHAGEKCFLIADGFITASDYFAEIYSRIEDIVAGQWNEVEPNPSTDSVNKAFEAASRAGTDAIIAIGGGSCIDTAKAVSLCLAAGKKIECFHSGGEIYPQRAVPVIAVPTTSGTGSEVTPISVLNDKVRKIKAPVANPCLFPVKAVVDPYWTVTMPPSLTAATGLDALSHAIEGYWSKGAFEICDCYALKAAQLIFDSLGKAINNGRDLKAREDMSLASLLAGMAFGQPKNAAVHACSFPLSTHFKMSHGVACAFTLEHFLRFNAQGSAREKLEAMARYCRFHDIDEMAESIRELKIAASLPLTFKDAGYDKIDMETLVRESFHPLMKNNPREVTKEDLYSIYQSLI